ncbi:MAG: hypothetical protein JJU34_07700, partial [Lunatimonas sp.]|uniref:hypothetical protein n=1 Tax=Lunatimonas sp. TaxID=2060141 RepID=UPI00263BBAB9
ALPYSIGKEQISGLANPNSSIILAKRHGILTYLDGNFWERLGSMAVFGILDEFDHSFELRAVSF